MKNKIFTPVAGRLIALLCLLLLNFNAVIAQNVFNNSKLRIGNGAENSINTLGNMQQPFYYQQSSSAWRKLTFNNYPLDNAFAVGGDGTNNWNISGTISQNSPLTNQTIDYSQYVSTGANMGYGTIVSTGNITIDGATLQVQNTYTLGQSASFIRIQCRVTNAGSTTATNVRAWIGTRDDYVGNADGPKKTKGNLEDGEFVAIPSTNTQAKAILIESGQEGVLFYSTNSRAYSAVNSCCDFTKPINTDPLNSPITTTGDGSYAMYMRLNDLAPGQSDEFILYYAAGATADLASIIEEVAQASGAVGNITSGSASFSSSSETPTTGYYIVVPAGSPAPTAAQIIAGTDYGTTTLVTGGSAEMPANTEVTYDLTGLSPSTQYTLYFVTYDGTDYSNIFNTSFTTPEPLVASVQAQTNVSCNGGTTGSATISTTGGTGPYTYAWSPAGGTAATATGLAAGTYTVTVTDASSGTTSVQVEITEPAPSAVSSVSAPLAGTYTAGLSLDFTVHYSEAITVTGTPSLSITLNTGTVSATYSSGSGSPDLVFSYLLQNGDQDPDGISVGALSLNGGTLKTSTGCNAGTVLNNVQPVSGILVKVPQTITFNALPSHVYGDADFDPGATTTSGLSITYTSGDLSVATIVAGKVRIISAGTAVITAAQAGDADYLSATSQQTLTVNPKPITVTAVAKTKIYGETDPALTYNFAPALIGSDAFSGTLTRASGENVGTYAITQGSLDLGSNYAITYTGDNLAITAKPVTVTAVAKTKVYGETDPALTYNFAPTLIGSDAFSGALARAAGENVGNYAITQGSLDLGSNYAITYTGDNLAITVKPVTVTAATKTKIYGETDPALTYNFAPALIGSDAFSGTLTRAAGENVGTYAITQGSLDLGSNYSISYTGDNLAITAKPVTVTAVAKTKIYGETDPALTYNFAPALIGSDAFSGTLTRAAGENVGTYAITQGSLDLGSNYTISYTGDNLAITAKPITVFAAAQTKTYGNADPALTFNFGPALVGSDVFSGVLTRTAGENVGAYAITQGSLDLGSNYTISYTGNNLSITAKPVTVTAVAKTKTYGDTDPALTYNVSPALIGSDAFSGTLVRSAGENVGAYAITQGSLDLGSNYSISYTGDNLSVTAKPVTVTAVAKTKIYGDADPALTYNVSPALIGSDAFSGTLVRSAGENVGTYAITQGSLDLGSNYTISYTGDNLAITAKPVTATAVAQSKTYGDADPALTYNVSPALIGSDAFSGALSRTIGENVGTYAINQGSLTLSTNYLLSYTSADLAITAKPVTVTAAAKTKIYGDADPALTYTVSPALIGSDAFSGALTRAAGENVGTYAIAQGSLDLGSNYTISYTGDNLAITAKPITVFAAAQTKTYGNADPALTFNFGPALVGSDVFSGVLTRAAGENIGTYAIAQGSLDLGSNYTISYTGNNLSITAKPVTVTAAAKSKTYGEADPALTYSVTPALVGSDAFSGALTRATGENVGTYAITQGSLDLGSNYTISYTGDNLSVTAKPVTVTAVAKTKIYGETDPALTYNFAPALVGSDVFSGTLTRAAGENVGTYAITQGSLDLGSNYTITYTGNNLSVTAKSIAVTAAAKTKTYGDADPALTYNFSPALVGSDVFSGALSRATGQNAGPYAITQGTLALSSNYQLNYTGANLVINKATLTATAADRTICYNDALAGADIPVSYTGFKNGEGVAAISSQLVVSIPSYNTAGNYSLTPSGGSATNYTFSYVNGQLTVLPIPAGNIAQVPAAAGTIAGFQLTAPSGPDYAWSTGETAPVITVRASGNYSVRVTNQEGCHADFSTQIQLVTISVPNTFSPNGDGINDYWVIPELKNYPNAYVLIVNRDGQTVFESRNFSQWDGRRAGQTLPAGVYFYRVRKQPGDAPVTGWLNLVR